MPRAQTRARSTRTKAIAQTTKTNAAQNAYGTPIRLTAASAQLARASNTSGRRRPSSVALTILSASVRLHEGERAATKCCQSAAAMPASASSRPRSGSEPAAGRAAPGQAEQGGEADGEKDQSLQHAPRARLHRERVLRDQRDGDRAEREQGDGGEQARDHRAAVAGRRPDRGRCRHSAAWAISSISTQAPSGSWATP